MAKRKPSLLPFVVAADAFPGDGTVGSFERYAGIRDRFRLWRRADKIIAARKPYPAALRDDSDAFEQMQFHEEFSDACQRQINEAIRRCRRLGALRRWRNECRSRHA